MTKKLLYVLAAATTLFLSCTKEDIKVTDTGITENVGLVVKVTVPKTKFAYADEGASGLDMTLLNNKDRLIAYFRDSEGGMIGSAVPMNLDPSTLSGDKKSGTFKAASPVEIPAEAASIFFYLDNEDNDMYSLTEASINNLKEQDGTLDDVAKHQVIVGSATVASLGTDGSGNKVATITFEYKTSVLKLAITFPDGVVPTADDNTTITLTDPNVYNSVRIAWGGPHSSAALNSKGAISVHPCSVSGQVATAYVTVWGGSNFADAKLTGKVGDVECELADVDAAAATVAGKIHNLARTLGIPNLSKWVTDAATDVDFVSGLTVDTPVAWMTYNSGTGKISLAENTTGEPRSEELTFTNGSTVNITQIEAKDFKGDWTFYSNNFVGTNGLGLTSSTTGSRAVTFGDPLGTETLDDEDSGITGITNNIGISGLFGSAIMNAIIDVNYENKKVNFGLFFDARSAQYVPTNNASYPYVFFVPELGQSWIAKTYNFALYPLGSSQNYGWIWFEVNSTFDKVSYGHKDSYRWYWDVEGSGAAVRSYVVGITVLSCTSATPSAGNMKATANGTSNYEYIYQANYSKTVYTYGFYFQR